MDGMEGNQNQAQSSTVFTNNQDPFVDFWAMRKEIMSMYQEICGTLSVSIIPVSTNNHLIQVTPTTVLFFPPNGFNYYTIGVEGLKL